MHRERTHWLPIGIVLTAVAGLLLAVLALSGFAGAPSGDQLVSSSAGTTNLLLAISAAVFLGLEFAHMRRRPGTARRPQRVAEPIGR